jgi:hypothetical protein
VIEGRDLRLLRCMELPELSVAEVSAVLYPTLAYVEDQSGQRPSSILLCGFDALDGMVADLESSDLGVSIDRLSSKLGTPDQTNAGLLGLLESMGVDG